MYQSDISRDITASVDQALEAGLERLTEAGLVRHSDALLTRLPGSAGAQWATTATLLGRYHKRLHQQLCMAQQPRRLPAASLREELRELTRAVLVTVGIGEGISVEAAVGMAFVLHRRGIANFCALHSSGASLA